MFETDEVKYLARSLPIIMMPGQKQGTDEKNIKSSSEKLHSSQRLYGFGVRVSGTDRDQPLLHIQNN